MSLRRIEKGDLEQILAWRNSDAVRLNMFSQEPIELEQHYQWFERMQTNESEAWWLYTDMYGEAVGVVYFTDIDTFTGTSFWGFYVDPQSEKGTGFRMGKDALKKAFSELGLRKVYGDVLDFNTHSQRFHEKLGFLKEGCMRKHYRLNESYCDVVRYGLLKNEWQDYASR